MFAERNRRKQKIWKKNLNDQFIKLNYDLDAKKSRLFDKHAREQSLFWLFFVRQTIKNVFAFALTGFFSLSCPFCCKRSKIKFIYVDDQNSKKRKLYLINHRSCEKVCVKESNIRVSSSSGPIGVLIGGGKIKGNRSLALIELDLTIVARVCVG